MELAEVTSQITFSFNDNMQYFCQKEVAGKKKKVEEEIEFMNTEAIKQWYL